MLEMRGPQDQPRLPHRGAVHGGLFGASHAHRADPGGIRGVVRRTRPPGPRTRYGSDANACFVCLATLFHPPRAPPF
jgi:hypothetical protein